MIALRCSVLFLLLGLINAICILNCDNRNECTYSTDEENNDSTVCRCMTNGDNIKIVDRLRKTSLKNCKNVYLVEVDGRTDVDICQYFQDYAPTVRFYSAGQHVFCHVVSNRVLMGMTVE